MSDKPICGSEDFYRLVSGWLVIIRDFGFDLGSVPRKQIESIVEEGLFTEGGLASLETATGEAVKDDGSIYAALLPTVLVFPALERLTLECAAELCNRHCVRSVAEKNELDLVKSTILKVLHKAGYVNDAVRDVFTERNASWEKYYAWKDLARGSGFDESVIKARYIGP